MQNFRQFRLFVYARPWVRERERERERERSRTATNK